MKEKKARVEDALNSTRAAVEDGIVAGGGVALLRTQPKLENLKTDTEEQQFGVQIIKRAIEEPLRQIAHNAGIEPAVVVDVVKKASENEGLNAMTENYEDMFKAGIIDPTKVTKAAITNAASVASLLLTTEAMIADKPEDKNAAPAGGHGPAAGGMGGMGGNGRHGWHDVILKPLFVRPPRAYAEGVWL